MGSFETLILRAADNTPWYFYLIFFFNDSVQCCRCRSIYLLWHCVALWSIFNVTNQWKVGNDSSNDEHKTIETIVTTFIVRWPSICFVAIYWIYRLLNSIALDRNGWHFCIQHIQVISSWIEENFQNVMKLAYGLALHTCICMKKYLGNNTTKHQWLRCWI